MEFKDLVALGDKLNIIEDMIRDVRQDIETEYRRMFNERELMKDA